MNIRPLINLVKDEMGHEILPPLESASPFKKNLNHIKNIISVSVWIPLSFYSFTSLDYNSLLHYRPTTKNNQSILYHKLNQISKKILSYVNDSQN